MRYESDDRDAGLPEELPVWEDIDPSHDGLSALGLTPSQIKQIWRRKGDVTVEVPKKDGGTRVCSGPNATQKMLSMSLLVHLMGVHDSGIRQWSEAAFGFVPGHGNIDMAHAMEGWMREQTGDITVAYCDLKGAFGAVTVKQVRSVLLRAGLTGQKLELAVRLTTRPDPESGRMVLTTGNPVSPLILNAALLDLDDRLMKLARGRGGYYARYADDLVISGLGRKGRSLKSQLTQTIRDAGFTPHPKKQGVTTSCVRKTAPQYICVEVVGVMVERTAYRRRPDGAYTTQRKVAPRRLRRRIRAMRHRGHTVESRPLMGRVRYARACRSWSRPKPEFVLETASEQVASNHRSLLARRQRRRNSQGHQSGARH